MANPAPEELHGEPDAAFAAWLDARHKAIARGNADTNHSVEATGDDSGVPKEYEHADRCLRALAQIRTLRQSTNRPP